MPPDPMSVGRPHTLSYVSCISFKIIISHVFHDKALSIHISCKILSEL